MRKEKELHGPTQSPGYCSPNNRCFLFTHLVGDGLLRGPGAVPALDSNDLEVQGAKAQAVILPGVEMVGDRDSAAGAAAAADGDVLVKGAGALNGRRIDARVLPDGVGAAVAADRALHCARL